VNLICTNFMPAIAPKYADTLVFSTFVCIFYI